MRWPQKGVHNNSQTIHNKSEQANPFCIYAGNPRPGKERRRWDALPPATMDGIAGSAAARPRMAKNIVMKTFLLLLLLFCCCCKEGGSRMPGCKHRFSTQARPSTGQSAPQSPRMTHPCTTHPGYKQNTSTEYLYKPTSTATLTIPPPPKKTKSGERQIRDFLRTRFPCGCTAWNKIDGGFYVAAQLHLGSGMSRVRVLQKGLRLFPKQWPRVRRLGTADRLGTQFGAGEPGYC